MSSHVEDELSQLASLNNRQSWLSENGYLEEPFNEIVNSNTHIAGKAPAKDFGSALGMPYGTWPDSVDHETYMWHENSSLPHQDNILHSDLSGDQRQFYCPDPWANQQWSYTDEPLLGTYLSGTTHSGGQEAQISGCLMQHMGHQHHMALQKVHPGSSLLRKHMQTMSNPSLKGHLGKECVWPLDCPTFVGQKNLSMRHQVSTSLLYQEAHWTIFRHQMPKDACCLLQHLQPSYLLPHTHILLKPFTGWKLVQI